MSTIKINPIVILFFNFMLPLVYIFKVSPIMNILFMSFAFCILLMTKKYSRLIKFSIFYILLNLIVHLMVIGKLRVMESMISVFITMIGFTPCFIMASVLILDYSSSHILSCFQQFRLSKRFIIAVTITLRYIPTFRREFGLIKETLRLRGIPYTIKHPVKSLEYFIVPQLFRCSVLAQEITSAGLVKGIDSPQKRTSYIDVGLKPLDVFLLVTILLISVGGFLYG